MSKAKPMYDGSSSLERWTVRMDNLADEKNWISFEKGQMTNAQWTAKKNERMINNASDYLTGEALLWAERSGALDEETWDAFKATMAKKFGKQMTKGQCNVALYSLKKQYHEGIWDYVGRVREIAGKCKDAYTQEELKQVFLNGLPESFQLTAVALETANPTMHELADQFAKMENKIPTQGRPNDRPTASWSNLRNDLSGPPTTNWEPRQQRNPPPRYSQNGPREPNLLGSRNSPPRFSNQSSMPQRGGGPKCYGCGETGHIRRNCPTNPPPAPNGNREARNLSRPAFGMRPPNNTQNVGGHLLRPRQTAGVAWGEAQPELQEQWEDNRNQSTPQYRDPRDKNHRGGRGNQAGQ